MPEFKNALNEIYATQNKIILFMTILRSLAVFLGVYFVLRLFNFYPFGLGFAVGMIYFGVKLHKDVSNKNLLEIEKKNPYLMERLRTAADYANTINYVVSRLHLSVLRALKAVNISSFIDIKKVSYLVISILLLTGLVIFSTANNIQIYDLREGLSSLSFLSGRNILGDLIPQTVLDADITVEDLNDNAIINELSNAAQQKLAPRDLYLPEDIFSTSDKSFEEQIPKKKRIYIREYFSQIRKYGME